MDVDGFGDLLQQAQQLTADMDSGVELPRVDRNLRQISQIAGRLANKAPLLSHESTDVKASLLLASKGYNVQKAAVSLEGLSSAKSFEPRDPIRDTDIVGFLKNERENALLAVIEATRKHTFEEIERRHWECLENEWEREKQKILNALVGAGQGTVDFPQETESLLSDTISMQGRSTMDNVELAYAKQVYVYNDQVIQGGIKPNLAELCAQVGKTLDDTTIQEMWAMLRYMTDVPIVTAGSVGKTIQEMWTMLRYMTDVPIVTAGSVGKARNSTKLKAAFVIQALKYLEESYLKYMRAMVESDLHRAELGGKPGTYNLVRSFLNVRMPTIMPGMEENLVEGHPVWAMLFYCLRCGDLAATWQIVHNSQSHLDEFSKYFREYMTSDERRLSPSSERDIRLLYKRAIRNSGDPYKRAVYCILGRCDPRENHAEVAEKTDDYLWVKLSQLHSEEEEGGQDRMTLHQLQSMLLEEYGENHFSAYQQPWLYFRVLFLTAQFEAAIEFLSRLDRLRCHAVHAALVLHEQRMLLSPQNIQSQLLSKDSLDSDSFRRLNLVRLVMMYTRKFEVTDPREALQYFYFLRDFKGSCGESLFMTCVSELVLETREFDMLLGQLCRDGSRKPGAIEKFHGDTQRVIELVARDAEEKGLFEDAVKLYDLAMNAEKVLELLNKLLTQVLVEAAAPHSTKDRLKSLAVSIAERYRNQGVVGSQATTSTFYLLLDLMTFFDLFHSNKHEQAYNIIKDLKLLPLTVEDVDAKVNAFRHYSDEVRRSLPDILLAAMKILYTQYSNAKSGVSASPQAAASKKFGTPGKFEDGGKQSYLTYLRCQARALITFAGMIPYRMPGATNARLVQMEVLMN